MWNALLFSFLLLLLLLLIILSPLFNSLGCYLALLELCLKVAGASRWFTWWQLSLQDDSINVRTCNFVSQKHSQIKLQLECWPSSSLLHLLCLWDCTFSLTRIHKVTYAGEVFLRCLQQAVCKKQRKKGREGVESWVKRKGKAQIPLERRKVWDSCVTSSMYQVFHTAVMEKKKMRTRDGWKLIHWTDDRHACRNEKRQAAISLFFFSLSLSLSPFLPVSWSAFDNVASYKVSDGTLAVRGDDNALPVCVWPTVQVPLTEINFLCPRLKVKVLETIIMYQCSRSLVNSSSISSLQSAPIFSVLSN